MDAAESSAREHDNTLVLTTGVQALVHLMVMQAEADRGKGLRTGGFVSGYRGSPLGTVDRAFERAKSAADAAGIIVRPAVNEEMAATAIAGTQQIAQSNASRVAGVFSLWYGKGPGLDRASDAIRHGNFQGSSPHGGVVLAVGDDHTAKSSSIVCVSDEVLVGLSVPFFYPADASELIQYGLHGFALSRHSGSWAALKITPEVADATHTVRRNELRIEPTLPAGLNPDIVVHNRWPDSALDQEARQRSDRLPAVLRYVRANRLDVALHRTARSRIGIVAAGKSWLDLCEALRLLGLSAAKLEALGVALYKPALVWPLEPESLREFALGLETVVVVEEKGPLVERQIKEILYGLPQAPQVLGKRDNKGEPLVPATGGLNPERIAVEIGPVLLDAVDDDALKVRVSDMRALVAVVDAIALPPTVRKPFYCSGCPHNRSTVLPEGSRALSGIGCHSLTAFNRADHGPMTQMGGEGVTWVGLAPFTDESHVFANMGDGTYFHSGFLAIRQAVAANVNITYKLLYNNAVAMTGGQPVDGNLTVASLVDQLRAEGVKSIALVTDDVAKYEQDAEFTQKIEWFVHRDEFDALQKELRRVPGVSVVIYDQMCATEKRRLRKRGKAPDRPKRIFINQSVCEGCGDCSVQSGCLSVEPVATPFGIKRRINQASCNKDYSCTNGFCPSFVAIAGVKPKAIGQSLGVPPVPAPPTRPAPSRQRILVAGIGGTGIVTIGALLSTAANLSSTKAAVLDQVGLAQKGGAVLSHIHLGGDDITALRIPAGQADLVIACDEVVGNARDVFAAIRTGHTKVIANSDVSITGDFTDNRNAIPDASLLTRRIRERVGADNFASQPFTRLSERLLGDSIGTNLMMVGYAYQRGWLAVDPEALVRAITLNGAAIKLNEAAFAWGRALAVDPAAIYRAARLESEQTDSLEQVIARGTQFLTEYQDARYAQRFAATVAKVKRAEDAVSSASALTEAVARSLLKLMAYKDEYEVARLYTDGSFARAIADQFEGKPTLEFYFAPPLLSRWGRAGGPPRKLKFGPWVLWMLRVLARLKFLRGTAFDVLGRTAERRQERALVQEFETMMGMIAERLTRDNLEQAIAIAQAPGEIKGFGHVKDAAVNTYRRRISGLMDEFGANQAISSESRVAAVG